MTYLDPCPLEKLVTCPARKSTCPGLLDGNFFQALLKMIDSILFFLIQKAEKRYGKINHTSPSDSIKTNASQLFDKNSDDDTGDEKSGDERDLGNTSEEEEKETDNSEQDDLLVLKKRHVNFDPGPLANQVLFLMLRAAVDSSALAFYRSYFLL